MFGHCQVLGELSCPALCQLCLCSWALSQPMRISTAQETHFPVMTWLLCSSPQLWTLVAYTAGTWEGRLRGDEGEMLISPFREALH